MLLIYFTSGGRGGRDRHKEQNHEKALKHMLRILKFLKLFPVPIHTNDIFWEKLLFILAFGVFCDFRLQRVLNSLKVPILTLTEKTFTLHWNCIIKLFWSGRYKKCKGITVKANEVGYKPWNVDVEK